MPTTEPAICLRRLNIETKIDDVPVLNNVILTLEMQAKGMNFNISLPNVTVGISHSHAFPSGVPVIVIPFQTEQGDFTVEVCIKLG